MTGAERNPSFAFSCARVNVLRMLAFQAATSLNQVDNSAEPERGDARARRLFNANIIGIFTWNLDGRILDANEAFLRIVGYSSDDLASGTMRWKDLMPPDWNPEGDLLLDALKSTGIAPPFEAEYIRQGGSQVPVLIGAALFDGTPTEGVAFVLDLTERMRAEAAAHENLRRYHELQMRMAHANRIASIGQLSASIAHEINQPLAGITINAGTCLRMLATDPPQIEGAQEAARRMIRDVERASQVITRLRALFARDPAASQPMDLNDATQEVLTMASAELQMKGVVLEADLADDLPPVSGDRVQLQRVIMNMVRNALDAMKDIEPFEREQRCEINAKKCRIPEKNANSQLSLGKIATTNTKSGSGHSPMAPSGRSSAKRKRSHAASHFNLAWTNADISDVVPFEIILSALRQ